MIEAPIAVREKLIAQEDAELLRKYKKFLAHHRLNESLWCAKCAQEDRPDGLRASVTDERIYLECRCTVRRYTGRTY